MAAPYEDEGLVESDDYYAWLGISKEANQDEINYAFRKLSRIYHPDKHAGNREAEQQAERLFTRIKKAHEILSDPHQRAIYDTVGTSGLETEGWQVISRTKSPREILEEYEALQAQREQQLLQRQTNPRGRVTMAINATNMFEHYDPYDDFDDDDTRTSGHLFPYVEVSELSISQSVDCPLTTKDSVTIAGNVFSSNGTGTGNMATTYRRVVSPDCWVEADASVGNELGLGCRLFRNLWKNAHGIMSGSCQVTSKGIKPVCSFTLAQQLDQRLQCRMALRLTPRQSSLQTLCAWDNGRHRVSAAVQLGVPNTFVKLNYFLNLSDYELKLRANFKFGTLSWLAEYGCDKKITAFSTLGVAMAIGVPTGVMLEIKLQRGNQTFVVPIQLSEEISQEPVIYGTVVPLVVFAAVRSLLVAPFLKEQKEKDLRRKKDANSRRMQERKREAETAVELMQATVERIREEETHKGGLLVNKAVYGKLVEESLSVESRECVDVTSALQVLVKDSKILIAEGTKLSELQGFFDPCVGEEKQICVNYTFRTRLHVCTFTEGQRILLPNRNHQCETQNER